MFVAVVGGGKRVENWGEILIFLAALLLTIFALQPWGRNLTKSSAYLYNIHPTARETGQRLCESERKAIL